MTIPTQDILYNALGSLIKERKIYHTGEGYFIVTPQTYFITNTAVNEKNWWTGDSEHPSPPPITYLMSNDTCLDASIEVPTMAHCQSCSCFTPQPTAPPSVQEQSVSISECTGKSIRWPREHKPTVQHQSTSTAADQASEISKSTITTRKDKEKPGRKFGLNLFRRNTGKKENKVKKEYSTFSGQFPPEEWPVRDEDDLNNLPRDLEHAIIKRINPELTVDNLVRHTVLMKKLEEKAERVTKALTSDKGMSTEILIPRQRHHSTKAGNKRPLRANRSKRRSTSTKEKMHTKHKDIPHDENLQTDDVITSHLRPEIVLDQADNHEECAELDAKCVYKKRIEDPFQPIRDANATHKEQRRRETKASSRRDRTGHRSKSWDPYNVKEIDEEVEKAHALMDRSCERLDSNRLNSDSVVDVKAIKELSEDYSSVYPDNSTVRIEEKQRDSRVRGRQHRDGKAKEIKKDLKSFSDQKHMTNLVLHPYETTELPRSWSQPLIQRRLSHHLVNSKEESEHCPDLLSSHQQSSSQHLADTENLHTDTGHISEVYTDDENHIYQKVEEDDDCCSSLCFNEERVSELPHSGTARCRDPVCLDGDWERSFIENTPLTVHIESIRTTQRQHEYRWQTSEHKISQSHPSADGIPDQKPRCLDEIIQEPSSGHSDPTDTLDSSIFDYCQTTEEDLDTETMQKSVDEGDTQVRHWNSHSHTKDFSKSQSEDLDHIHCASAHHCDHTGVCIGETENQSYTADSGIDSPRLVNIISICFTECTLIRHDILITEAKNTDYFNPGSCWEMLGSN